MECRKEAGSMSLEIGVIAMQCGTFPEVFLCLRFHRAQGAEGFCTQYFPPLASIPHPVMKAAASEARNTTTEAISSGVP